MRYHHLRLPCATIVALVTVLVGHAPAADRFWIDPGGGLFRDSANWSASSGGPNGASVPRPGDNAIFDLPRTYTVTLDTDAAIDLLDVDAGTITFNSNNRPYTFDVGTGAGDATISGADVTLDETHFDLADDFSVVDGTMRVIGGSDVTVADRVSIATSTGNAELRFDNSTFDFGGQVRMGLSGFDATLELKNGSTGIIGGDLDFARSATLGSGGFLNVESGSTLTTNGQILLGDILTNGSPNYNTFITVDGEGSIVAMNGANNLRVGDSMFDNVNAELRVQNKGDFRTASGGGNTIVQRTGLLTLESGGIFNARNDLQVTQTGEINVTGGVLNTEALFSIDAASSVTLDGGEINAMAGLDNSAGGVINFRNGPLTVTGGPFVPDDGTPASGYSIDGPTDSELPHLKIGAGATADIGRRFIVGSSRRGMLTIEDGGSVLSTRGDLGANAPGNGSVIVDGENSTWTISGDLFVGFFGKGTLEILDRGAVFSETGDLGLGNVGVPAEGTVVVDGQGSMWRSTGYIRVGSGGRGALSITNAGSVESSSGTVGQAAGTSNVVVDGEGSNWTMTGTLDVDGMVSISNGGTVAAASAVGDGVIELDGGTLSLSSASNAIDNMLQWRSGTLEITGASGWTILSDLLALDANQHLEVTNTLTIDPDAELFASGGLSTGSLVNNGDLVLASTTVIGPVTNNANITVIGDVTFDDLVDGPGGFYGPGTAIFTGGMSPGASPASVGFEGSVTFGEDNHLLLELGGLSAGDEFDQLNVAQSASLAGFLDVSLLEGFSPQLGDVIEIVTAAGGVVGTFTPGTMPDLGLLTLETIYGTNSVFLAAVPALDGDYNADGFVDAADYVAWRNTQGATGVGLAADGDRSGTVDADDYLIWSTNYGTTATTTGVKQSTTVPEPQSIFLWLTAMALTTIRQRRNVTC